METDYGTLALDTRVSEESKPVYSFPNDEWSHHEIQIEVPHSYDLRYVMGVEHTDTESYIDNVLVSSVHGPSLVNLDGYNFLYKGF